MPHRPHALERRESLRERDSPLVRHVNAIRVLRIKRKAVVREQNIVAVAFHHFFGKVMFVTHDGVQVQAVLEQPKRHVVAMLRINDIVARRNTLAEFRKHLTEEFRIRLDDGEFHLGALTQEFANHGHATSRMPKPPIQRSYKNLHFSASSQASAQSP